MLTTVGIGLFVAGAGIFIFGVKKFLAAATWLEFAKALVICLFAFLVFMGGLGIMLELAY